MAWRGLHVSRATRLSLADNQIVAKQDDVEARIPIEDLAWIVLDSPQVMFSTALMSACMNAGVVVITTDQPTHQAVCYCPFIGITGRARSPICKRTSRHR